MAQQTTSGKSYGPSIKAARLYRRKSEKGTTYFSGYMGLLRVTLVKSQETADDGGEIWNLLVSEAPPRQPQNDKANVAEPQHGGRS